MSALVPYVPGAVSAFRTYKRRRVITPVARVAAHWAYHNSGTAARAIQRAWRRRRRPMKRRRPAVRKRTQPAAKRTAKQVEEVISSAYDDVRLRSLNGDFLPAPQAPQDPADFNVRERANVYYSGFKICRIFENRGTGGDNIYTVNYCIVQWNPGEVSDETASPAASTVIGNAKRNFFRNSEATTGNTKNFVDAPISGSTVWDIHYDCAPMNPRKGYKILLRKKFTLYPRYVETAGDRNQNRLNQNFKRIEMYIPIKKRLQFQSRNSPQPNAFFFELWWTNTRSPEDWPGTNPGADVFVKTLSQHKVYFRQ